MNNTELTKHLCEKSYMQGIEDMKEIILTIEQMYDDSNDDNDNDLLTELFGCSHDNYRMIFDNFTVSEIQDKIKHYKQLTEVPIYEVKCEICGAKYNNYFRTMYIQYSNNENDKKCTCLKCWREQAVIKPYRYTNHIPDFCDGGNLITILFDTKEDLLKYILQNTKDNKIACISENGDKVIDVNTDEKYWCVRGYSSLDKNDLPHWKDKVEELYGKV